MKEIYTLENLEQIKALADSLRVQVLEAFCQKPMTTKQVALLLGEKPTKLYHHVEALARVGLLELIETRRKRGTTEKYYQPIAKQFAVNRKLLSISPAQKNTAGEVIGLFTGALEDTIAEIRESASLDLLQPEDDGSVAVFSRGHLSGTKKQITEAMKKLQEWLEECRAAHDERGAARYGLTVAFYPVNTKQKTAGVKRNLKTDIRKKTKK